MDKTRADKVQPHETATSICTAHNYVGCLDSAFVGNIMSKGLLPGPVLSCPVLSCPVLSCPVLSCPVPSCPVLSCPVLSCPVLFCPVLSCPVACNELLCSACRKLHFIIAIMIADGSKLASSQYGASVTGVSARPEKSASSLKGANKNPVSK